MERSEKINKDYLILGGLIAMTLVSGAILSSIKVNADDSTVDDISITVPVSCSLSSTGNDSHTATIPNGIYSANYSDTTSGVDYTNGIGTTTIKAYCNDNNGFSIYAIGYTGEEYGATNLVGNITNLTIPTGIYTAGDTTSKWSMKLTATSGTYAPIIAGSTSDTEKLSGDIDYSNYAEIPEEYTRVAYKNSITDIGTNAEGSILTTTYAAYISSTQAADTYEGKVKFTLVHPASVSPPAVPLATSNCPANKICYVPNANDIVGSMSSLGVVDASSTAGAQSTASNANPTLVAPNYSRSGYGFAGWSTDFAATSSSVIYGPNQTITISTSGTGDADVSTNGLILYPVWVASVGTIQDWGGCSDLTVASGSTTTLNSVTALTDQRDGNTYAVARLADGKCWMIENLRLEAENTRTAEKQALAEGYGASAIYGNFGGLADSENANFTATTNATDTIIANSLYYSNTPSGTASIDIGATGYPGFRMPRYNDNNINRELTASYNGNGSDSYYQWYSYGNYYTWHAAIADLTYNETNNQNVIGTSLCPAGWHLPTGGQTTVNTTADFYILGKAIMDGNEPESSITSGSNYYGPSTKNNDGDNATKAFRRFPNNFIYAGSFSSASMDKRGSSGRYWASTSSDNRWAYFLDISKSMFQGDYVDPGVSGSKAIGVPIRCVNRT